MLEYHHIYCERRKGLGFWGLGFWVLFHFHHHGILVWDGERKLVYHVRKDRSCADLCSGCKGIQQPESGPIISCLDCFSKQERIYTIKYRKRVSQKNLDQGIVNGSLHPGRVIQGYCSEQLYLEYYSLNGELYCHTKISSKKVKNCKHQLDGSYVLSEFSSCKSAADVVATARGGGPGLGKYWLVMNNCEDFAVYCHTNKAWSIQVARRLGYFYRALKWHSTGRSVTDAFKLRDVNIKPDD